jgi:hypothetical protein
MRIVKMATDESIRKDRSQGFLARTAASAGLPNVDINEIGEAASANTQCNSPLDIFICHKKALFISIPAIAVLNSRYQIMSIDERTAYHS